MKLSELLKSYRLQHDISMDMLAQESGVSKGYISMLENERNPKTGKPISPSLDTLAKLAKGMGITLDDLIKMADDMIVDLDSYGEDEVMPLSTDELSLIRAYRLLNRDGKRKAAEYLTDLSENKRYLKDTELLNA